MAAANDPNEYEDLYEYLSNPQGAMDSDQTYVKIVTALKTMKEIEDKSKETGSFSNDILEVYMDAYSDVQGIFLLGEKYANRISLFLQLMSFFKSMNKRINKKIFFSMYTSNYFRPLLELGKIDEAKKALLKCKKIFDEIDMNLLSIEYQLEIKSTLYHSYFKYYKNPLSLNGPKMVYNGVCLLKFALKRTVETNQTIIGELFEVIEETIKNRAFRQSHYLLRAFKVIQKSVKNNKQEDIFVNLIKADKLPSIQCMNQLLYAMHMLKILSTMKERVMAEEKLSQGLSLNKNEKSCFKIIEDCYTLEDIEVPEEDEILDGLLKNEDEIKMICRQIQKRIKSVKASQDENMKEDGDLCLAELKDLENFFNIKN